MHIERRQAATETAELALPLFSSTQLHLLHSAQSLLLLAQIYDVTMTRVAGASASIDRARASCRCYLCYVRSESAAHTLRILSLERLAEDALRVALKTSEVTVRIL